MAWESCILDGLTPLTRRGPGESPFRPDRYLCDGNPGTTPILHSPVAVPLAAAPSLCALPLQAPRSAGWCRASRGKRSMRIAQRAYRSHAAHVISHVSVPHTRACPTHQGSSPQLHAPHIGPHLGDLLCMEATRGQLGLHAHVHEALQRAGVKVGVRGRGRGRRRGRRGQAADVGMRRARCRRDSWVVVVTACGEGGGAG